MLTPAMPQHKDTHDPEDGSDPLDCDVPSELVGVQAGNEGSAHKLARADHVHPIVHSIVDNHLVTVAGSPSTFDYVRFSAQGLQGRNYAAVRSDLKIATTWHIQIPLPVVGEEHIVKLIKHAATMQEVRDKCKAATNVTYSLYNRARATPWTAAGQTVIVNGGIATTTENEATRASSVLGANTFLICKVIAFTGVPEDVVVSGHYVTD